MLYIKEGITVFSFVTKKIHISLDVYFMEKQPFLNKNHLQGENIVEEDNFWQVSEPLLELILIPIHYNGLCV